MSLDLVALRIDAVDPAATADFWSRLLGFGVRQEDGAAVLEPDDDTGFVLRFVPAEEPKSAQNHAHFDLTSARPEDQRATVDRVLALGGRHVDVGQLPEEGHVVLADPEGNEMCVIPAGNSFLADCGFVGAVSSDGSAERGRFWSEALGWPLVWDQDEETAIRAPYGGPKITWGGPPYMAPEGKDRWRFELAPGEGGGVAAEVDRLVVLGARRLDEAVGVVSLTDPDGYLFTVAARSRLG